jgi:transglutaminase/protease-like cytokinesis protein 3
MNVVIAATAARGEITTMTTPSNERHTDTASKNNEARSAPRRPAGAPQKAKPARRTGSNKKAADSRKDGGTARRGSKTAKILDLLKRPGGATLKEIMKATAWQPHSVRGFLSGTLRKKFRMNVDSFKRDDKERTYRISSK